MNKRGITMTSIVIYVILFFIFTSIAITISTNMNYEALNQKGNIIINENIQKLQFNLLNSAKKSDSVYNIEGRIVFSNNDEYFFDSTKKEILKNNTTLVKDVLEFNIISTNEFGGNIDDDRVVNIEVKVKKYGNEKIEKMMFTVGDIYE